MDDLRVPTGFLFSILGLILLVYSLVNPAARAPMAAEVNVNLWCGLMLLIFGGILLWLARRKKS